MKVAVRSIGKNIDSSVASVFGRCPFFIIVEVKNKVGEIEVIDNLSTKKAHGAGISAAWTVAERGAKVVITGNVGPRAMDILKQFKIKTYKAEGPIHKAIQDLMKNKLEEIK